MSRPGKVTQDQVRAFLESHAEWMLQDNKLHREYRFRNFTEAFAFMAEVAAVAEQMDHHPEWFNVYQRVTVDLTTHDANGITVLDFELADRMEKLFLGMKG